MCAYWLIIQTISSVASTHTKPQGKLYDKVRELGEAGEWCQAAFRTIGAGKPEVGEALEDGEGI